MRRLNIVDAPIFNKLSTLADLMYVNILFVVCSLPLFTIGASKTAALFVIRKISGGDAVHLTRLFFSAFKENFKQSTPVWLVYILVLAGLFLDYKMFLQSLGERYHFAVVLVLTVLLFTVLAFGAYIFPLISRYRNSLRLHIKNAFALSFAYLPRTFMLILLNTASLLMPMLTTGTIVFCLILWLIVGFSISFLLENIILKKVFAHLEENSAAES